MGSSTDGAAMSAPLTVLAAVQLLEADGYTTPIKVLPDGSIRCGSCAQTHAIKSALVDRVFRFEGASDPDDEAIVLGLRCPHCDAKSVLVSAFGPNAEPAVLQQLVLLDARFREE
jgi:hypothetical protein